MVSEDAPNGAIIAAGAGVFTRVMIHDTMGVNLGTGEVSTISPRDENRIINIFKIYLTYVLFKSSKINLSNFYFHIMLD